MYPTEQNCICTQNRIFMNKTNMTNYIYHRFIDHFRKNTYFYSRPWVIIKLNIILSALIMIFYEPFGYHFDSWAEMTQLIGFSVIAFFYSVLFFLWLPQSTLMKKWMENWTIGKNAVYSFIFLFITGISISFYDFHLILQHSWLDYGERIFYICFLTDTIGVFTIGIVPLCVGRQLEKNHLLKQRIADIELKQEAVESRLSIRDDNAPHTIILTGETKESLEIIPENIIYLESSGNYVNVYYINKGEARKTIRSTFKSLEEQLSLFSFLVRCHRTYIVNVNCISNLDRNTQGYHLSMKNSNKEIPVSRTYLKQLKGILNL